MESWEIVRVLCWCVSKSYCNRAIALHNTLALIILRKRTGVRREVTAAAQLHPAFFSLRPDLFWILPLTIFVCCLVVPPHLRPSFSLRFCIIKCLVLASNELAIPHILLQHPRGVSAVAASSHLTLFFSSPRYIRYFPLSNRLGFHHVHLWGSNASPLTLFWTFVFVSVTLTLCLFPCFILHEYIRDRSLFFHTCVRTSFELVWLATAPCAAWICSSVTGIPAWRCVWCLWLESITYK